MEQLMTALWGRDASAGYAALKQLLALSRASDAVYARMDECFAHLDSPSAYVRTRALALIAANAPWDGAGRIDGRIGEILSHLRDPKPAVARQLIRDLPALVRVKPALRGAVAEALCAGAAPCYADSMRPLVEADMERARRMIEAEAGKERPV